VYAYAIYQSKSPILVNSVEAVKKIALHDPKDLKDFLKIYISVIVKDCTPKTSVSIQNTTFLSKARNCQLISNSSAVFVA